MKKIKLFLILTLSTFVFIILGNNMLAQTNINPNPNDCNVKEILPPYETGGPYFYNPDPNFLVPPIYETGGPFYYNPNPEFHNPEFGDPTPPPTCCFEPSDAPAVWWVHGAYGSYISWTRAHDWVNENYEVAGKLVDYGGDQETLQEAANRLDDIFTDLWPGMQAEYPQYNITDDSKRYVIAHSLGGITTRKAYESHEDTREVMEGMISFASPHGGADVAKAIDYTYNGNQIGLDKFNELKLLLHRGLVKLSKGPAIEGVSSALWNEIGSIGPLYNGIGAFLLPDATESALIAAASALSPVLASELIKSFFPGATSKFYPESGVLNINDNIPHKMATFGSIDGLGTHSVYNIMYSGINSVSEEGVFSADSHNESALELLKFAKYIYGDKCNNYAEIYEDVNNWLVPDWMETVSVYYVLCEDGNTIWSLSPDFFDYSCEAIDPVTLIDVNFSLALIEYLHYAYYSGYKQFEELNSNWELFVGAKDYTITLDQVPPYDEWVETVETHLYPYDGIITAESAGALPGVNYTPLEMKENNHFMVRNSSETRKALEAIFDGDFGPYFKAEKQ